MNEELEKSKEAGNRGPLPDPGWYPDKNGAARWWDGTKWSNRVRLPQAPPAAAAGEGKNNGTLLLVGWICALCVPFLGFVLGIVAIAKNEMQGLGMILVSFLMFFVWSALLIGA